MYKKFIKEYSIGFRILITLVFLITLLGVRIPKVAADASGLLEKPLFTFVQITDMDISSSSSASIVSQAATEINTLNPVPAFVVFTGDMVASPSSTLLRALKSQTTSFTSKVYYAIGDHDAGTDKTIFENQLGARNYSFTQGPYHFIVLDSTMPGSLLTNGGGFTQETLTWLKNDLSTVAKTTPIVVLCNRNFWSPMQYDPQENLFCDVENPDEIMGLFSSYNLAAVFAGHAHQNMQFTYNGTKFVISGAMSSAGVANVDYSPPGYTIAEVYSTHIETYWVPLGQIQSYYIKPKTFVKSVGVSGCDYNGTTSTTIQNAVNACHTNGGGTVVIKPGTYSEIDYPTDTNGYFAPIIVYSNVWLIGMDEATTILKFSDTNCTNKRGISNSWVGAIDNVRIKNLTIDGNKANNPNGVNSSHVWYNGIEIDGTQPIDSDGLYTHDIIVENVAFKNFWFRGCVGYGSRRWVVRNCTFDNMDAAIAPEHPNDYWQIEGNTITNSGEACTGDDMKYGLVYNNNFGAGNSSVFNPWIASEQGTATGNHFVYNTIHDMTVGATGAIDVHAISGTVEITHNTFTNVVTGVYWTIQSLYTEENIIGNNTYTNTPMHDYMGGGVPQVWAPDYLSITAKSSTSVTIQASGGYHMTSPYPTPNPPTTRAHFIFQKAEYNGTSVVLTNSTEQASDTYVWGNLNPSYDYAFRAKSVYPDALDSAWCEWIFSYSTALSISTSTLPNGTVGVAYSQTLTATGGTTPYTWTITSGTLPNGLSLSSSGVISGTPTTAGGLTSITFQVTDSASKTATKALSITINSATPSVTTSTLPNGTVSVAYSQTLTATGGTTPYTWSIASGTLPTGLSLSSSGVISGTPTTAGGPTSITFQVTDNASKTATKALSITINSATLSITTSTLTNGTVGIAYSQTLTATGGTTSYTWSISSGTLPNGLSLSSSGVISGTPTTAGGPTSIAFQVTDSASATTTKALPITIVQSPSSLIYPIAVWSEYYPIVTNSSEMSRFFSICVAEGYNVAYLDMDGDSILLLANDSSKPQNAYQTFIAAAKARGIKTYMMIGGTTANFANPSNDESYISDIIQYNINNPTVKIDGIIWDIEGDGPSDFGNYTNYIQTLKAVTYGGQTIVSQGLELAAYEDGYDTPAWRTFIHQFNRIDINSYASGLNTGGDGSGIIGKSLTAATVCQSEGVNFSIGIETDKLDENHNDYTVYDEGLDYYNTLRVQVDNYFTAHYTHYVGQYVSQYQSAIQLWYLISSSTFSYQGQTATAVISLVNSGDYQTSARGIAFQIKEANGTVHEKNYITTLKMLQTRTLTLTYTLPNGVDLTNCAERIVIYDIDKRNDSTYRDPVYYIYPIFYAAYNLPANIEDCTLTAYCAAVASAPTVIFDGYGRQTSELVVLDHTSWWNPPTTLSITTGSLPNGTIGVAYSQTLAATGGTTPYTWTIASGTLPTGLSLSSGGVVSGTPTAAGGPTSVTFKVTDNLSATATKALSITVGYAAWDVNKDGAVNVLDMISISQHWGETGSPGWIAQDVNGDGVINSLDMIIIGQHWNG